MRMQMLVTAFHMVDNLATGLYETVGQRLMELIRNSLVASMPNSNQWEPKRAKIELSLVQNHPLAPKGASALVVLDHGCGLTDPALERYFNWLGTPLSQLKERHNSSFNGASQKGVGRLAALALNEMCLSEDIETRIKNGYYLFSRTAKSGNVRFVPVIPEQAEREGGFETNRFISPTSTELGALQNMPGSFTAIVIPTPIFKNHTEICDAIKWFLPREQDKMFNLLIGGKAITPPPLEESVNIASQDGRYRARLGVGDAETEGVWLCDDQTGFRVANCLKLGRLLPDPLWFPDLVGDIFAPGLLRHQNTARSTLAKEFTRKGNKDWSKLLMFLISQVVPGAKQLIERDVIRGDAMNALDELVDLFNDRYGVPDEDIVRPPGGTRNPPGGPRLTKPPTDDPPENKRSRYAKIKVREETYLLYPGRTLHSFIFAQVNTSNPKMIEVNVRGGYKSLPSTKVERKEHCLMQILNAIAYRKYGDRPPFALQFANELRSELLRKS